MDLAIAVILQDPALPMREALEIGRQVRRLALETFPDKAQAYDWIYAPRLRRAVEERYGVRLLHAAARREP